MPIFDYQGTDGREIIDEAYQLAVYSNIDNSPITPPGWQELTAADLGVDPSLVDANGFFTDDGSINDGTAKVLAKTDADGNITQIAVSFTGTNSAGDLSDYAALVSKSYDNAFDYLLEAVRDLAIAEGLTGEDVQFTGYSLGGGAVNLAAEEKDTRLDGFFANSDYFGFSSPVIDEGGNVFNFGFENDAIFRIAGSSEAPTTPAGFLGNDNAFATSTDSIIFFNDDYADPNFPNGRFSFLNREAWSAHVESVSIDPTPIERIGDSNFYDYMQQDSTIILTGLSDETRGTTFVEPVDRVTGNHIGDDAFILGGEQDDLLGDGRGSDFLDGFAGNDTFRIGGGNDAVNGGEGTDTVQLSASLDSYEIMRLADGTTYFLDTQGDGGLEELAEVEKIDAGDLLGLDLGESGITQDGQTVATYETVTEGTDADDTLQGGENPDRIFGGDGNDTLTGEGGGDLLHGGDGDDTLRGGMGDDQLFGAGGEDVIEGDCGDDTLAGGAGSDTFVFDIRAGNDTITDFTAGNQGGDIIAFAEGIFADFSELTAASEQVGDDIVISFDDNSVVLEDVALSDLDAGNFLFA